MKLRSIPSQSSSWISAVAVVAAALLIISADFARAANMPKTASTPSSKPAAKATTPAQTHHHHKKRHHHKKKSAKVPAKPTTVATATKPITPAKRGMSHPTAVKPIVLPGQTAPPPPLKPQTPGAISRGGF